MTATKKAIIVSVLSLFLLGTASIAVWSANRPTEAPVTAQTVVQAYQQPTVEELLTATNEERAKNELAALTLNEKLNSAAQAKAAYMIEKDYWAHDAPDGTEPWTFIDNAGYNYYEAGENLAKNYSTGKETLNNWMNSTTHRTNVLKPTFVDVGFAVTKGQLGNKSTTIIVALYASPNL